MSDTNSPQPQMPATARPEVDPQSVEGLFLTVLAMDSPAERAAFLDQVCGDDAPRRRRIEALLRAYDDAGSFLEHPATPVASAENFDFLEPADKAGCLGRLGYYEVIDVIGRGGMGIVFRALAPRLNRIVAIIGGALSMLWCRTAISSAAPRSPMRSPQGDSESLPCSRSEKRSRTRSSTDTSPPRTMANTTAEMAY